MWTSSVCNSLLFCSSLVVLASAELSRKTRQDNGVDPAQVCECVSYDKCIDALIVSEALSSRYRTCEGVVDVCCLPAKYAYLVATTTPSPEPETPYKPEETPVLAPLRPQGMGCGLKRIPQGSYGQEVDQKIAQELRPPERTGFGEYPWMVALFRKNERGNTFVCGGSLIRPNVVLTGAHCLRRAEIGELKVRAGDWDIKSTIEPIPYEDRSVARIIPHPEFNFETQANNIALLILSTPFNITDSVDTICVPSYPGPNLDVDNCVATGWGMDRYGEKGHFQKVLRKVHLPLVRRDKCQEQLRKTRLGKYFKLHPSFICAGGTPEQDTCYGDGGGPLVCPKIDEKDRYVQVGIVSWGIGCGNENPGVYSSVQYFYSWIIKNLLLTLQIN